MINILLEDCNIAVPWLYDELKAYIKPYCKVAVIALSFRDSQAEDLSDWNTLYSKEKGRFYDGIVGGLTAYGLAEENISFINYFIDSKESAKSKVDNADILYFLGGLPDKMFERIKELDLYSVLATHKGIIMGYSAGAVIQLSEYHLSPDDDYSEFSFYEGLGYLNDFFLEVHYEGSEVQKKAVRRVIAERGKTVFATRCNEGAVIVDNGKINLLGRVEVFTSTALI